MICHDVRRAEDGGGDSARLREGPPLHEQVLHDTLSHAGDVTVKSSTLQAGFGSVDLYGRTVA